MKSAGVSEREGGAETPGGGEGGADASRFTGPRAEKVVPGLRVAVALSSGSVRIGETLWITVELAGERASEVGSLRLSVVGPGDVKVYDAVVWLPHSTRVPGAGDSAVYTIAWKVEPHPSGDSEPVPGHYEILVAVPLDGEEVIVEAPVDVVG